MDEEIEFSLATDSTKEKEDTNGFGKRIEILRSMLEMSKTDFAIFLHASRSTLVKLEKDGVLSQDMAYKIYYATTKAIEGPFNSERMRNFAKTLRDDIEQEVILAERNERIEKMINVN